MPILPALPSHLPAIQRLIQRSSTRLLQFGLEDLPHLLGAGVGMVGMDGPGHVWGFVLLQVELRPPTLPADAPDRAYVRGLLVERGRSLSRESSPLLAAALERLGTWGRPYVVILQARQPWLTAALTATGFIPFEEVRYYKYTRLEAPSASGPAHLAPIRPMDLAEVARLDASAFPAVWHMGEEELAGLFFASRFQAAWLDGGMVGYTALTLDAAFDDPTTPSPSAFLARLAVHPQRQGQGIGRQLLADAIAYANNHGYRPIYLNTQSSNLAAQHLYQDVGFRSMGEMFQVYVARLPAQADLPIRSAQPP